VHVVVVVVVVVLMNRLQYAGLGTLPAIVVDRYAYGQVLIYKHGE